MKIKHFTDTDTAIVESADIQAAVDYGIDISMLIDNINRSPSERIRRHQAALNIAEMLRKAKRK
jgi:hypothetical protein